MAHKTPTPKQSRSAVRRGKAVRHGLRQAPKVSSPERTQKVFGFTDIHWSDRDPAALQVAMRAHAAFNPDLTVIGGDLLNCDAFSRHPRSRWDETHGYDLIIDELEPAAAFLKEAHLRTQGGKGKLVWLEGNHDAWIERWIANNPLVGRALGSLQPHRFCLRGVDNNVEYIRWFPANSGSRASHFRLHPTLITVHGWAANKYAAERHLHLARPWSVIYHHSHRGESRTSRMYDNRITSATCAGCLCKLAPKYGHGGNPTDWSHGFWVAYVGKRDYALYPITIKGRGSRLSCILPSGQEITT